MNWRTALVALVVAPALAWQAAPQATAPSQPKIEARKSAALTKSGLTFRDLNKNGVLDPYEDWRLPAEQRISDLVTRMTVEEKTGLMIHSSLAGFTGPNGEVLGMPATGGRGGPGGAPAASRDRTFEGGANPNHVDPMGGANPTALISERHIRYILVRPNAGESPDITAKFHNGLQEMAEASRLGIPIVFSTDPRHGAGRGGAGARPVISQWPDQLGLAVARDPEQVRTFGKIAARELRAIGIQCLLGPMADTITEPRWNRISGTFGEDANVNATMIKAIVDGFQGKVLGPESVMTVTKHFPGDGPVKDGYDGHNAYGKWYIYPGNQFDHHLIPFKAALDAGTGGIMTAYGIPVGRDTVAIAFSKAMVDELLRRKMGFQGLVVTDWNHNMPWGVEQLSEKDRQKMEVLAGVDQIGGNNDPGVILSNVKDGSIPMAVIDTVARRVLRPIFQLGLFENPYVDPERAKATAASEEFLAAGYAAQQRAVVLLKNTGDLLPAATGKKIYVEGISREVAATFGTVVDDPKAADLAILRVASPLTTYPYGGAFAGGGGRGGTTTPAPPPPVAPFGITLAYGNAANWQVLEHIKKIAATGTKTVVIVNMDKPAILTEFIDSVAGVFGAFGPSDAALLDVVFGKVGVTGKLPFDVPSDMPSVMAQAADVPFDLVDPMFTFGFGLTYKRETSPPGSQPQDDPLLRGFQNPPDSAKPRVWWHWMSGNVTRDGIKADLEWMKRAGIGGFQNFDAGLNTPQIVEKRLVYMTPEWKDAFKYAATLADRLGLEMAIAGSPGWSESGGPWVTPAQAMKKYVWSETRVEGGRPCTAALPKPPSATGPYQNQAGGRGGFGGQAATQPPPPEFYADAAVVAYRAPDSDRPMSAMQPKVTASGGTFDVAALTDGDLAKPTLLPAAPVNERAWIQYEFPQAQTFRGLTLITGAGGGGRGGGSGVTTQLEVSDEGREFRIVTPIPGGARTIAFAPVTGRVFRISILTPPPQQNAARGGGGGFGGGQGGGRAQAPAGPAGTQIAEFLLHGSVVNRFQEKAAFSAATSIYAMATPTVPATDAIRKADVVDLTSKMRPDGTLDWTPPAGNWVVLRIGYSLTGQQNRPASPEATGLEVDKLNKAYVKAYFDNYLDQYRDATGGLMGARGLQYVITDSWEAGVANWTNDMIAEFAKRRGYDMKPWLPALAGHVVESAEATDRFLWDFRKTLTEMTAEYHYDQLTDLLKARGMARYTESHENGRAFIADGMEVKARAAVPMSAMWTAQANRPSAQFDADIRESASVAHIYGQNLVAAESLTAGTGAWSFSPETLKPTADRELSMGLNRFVIHTSVHQPVDDKIPGLGLGPFGQWFTRHETWAEQADTWTTYLARSSYMLQQGTFVADIAYYYGEDSNITALFQGNPPPIPAGYNFDYVNTDIVKNRLGVSPDGRLTTATGMSYRVLALDPNSQHMPLAVLRKIRDMVNAGAIVAGPRPIESPSLSDDAAEFKTIAAELWGGATGKGKVLTGSIADALASLKVAADFEYTKPQTDTELAFVHRKLSDGDMYWVSHRNARAEEVEATFRVQGKAPELWHAETGAVEPASYRMANGRTIVSLTLQPNDAVFVVFRNAATAPSRTIAKAVETKLSTVEGSWDVAFQPNRGAPARITLPALASWHENAEAGVKYFSGTGTYTRMIDAPANWFQAGAKLWLDLGDVKNIAVVIINGKSLGTYWKTPFRVDVTSALRPGANTLEVKVVNLWVNRLIGDQQEGVTTKYTYTAQQFYRADSPLLPSGLIGPVQLVRTISK